MDYNPPVGGSPGDPFVNANPGGGVEGSPVPAEAVEYPQREIVAAITAAGLTPDNGELEQLASAIQIGTLGAAVAGGTADAITAVFDPEIAALIDGMAVCVRAGAANATTTPTFTPAAGGIAPKTIVKGAGAALAAGDIAGAGHWIVLRYDEALDKWELQNPATGIAVQQSKQIRSVTASVSANALTVGLNPTTLDFRSATLTDGVPISRTISAALSLVVPSGATLGTVSGQAARLVLIAIDNGGSVELAIANIAGGVNLDETTLITTTAISGAANSASAIYSTTARANVPFRVVGLVDITEATAGTWATAPTRVQGHGGQALAALQSFGYGQAYQSVSIVSGTTYYNTTARPALLMLNAAVGQFINSISINGVSIAGYAAGTSNVIVSVMLAPGDSYVVNHTGLQVSRLFS